MGESRKDLVVYVIESGGQVIYVGQGTPQRAYYWRFQSRYKSLGLIERPVTRIAASGLTRSAAIDLEARLIAELNPVKNKARRSTAGSLVPHNKGKKGGKGGRPKGIPMSDEAKQKLSTAMMGKSTAWLKGKKPWNAGLTKDDPRVAKSDSSYSRERRSQAMKDAWVKRRGKE